MIEVAPVSRAPLPPSRRARSLAAAGLHEGTASDAPSRAREEPSIVAALCLCVLGEREGTESAAWPPRSVAELSGRSGAPANRMAQDAGLLDQGLGALDELALDETGSRFARLGHRAQLRSLFWLESGRSRLSKRHASAFINAFLSLAAHAYLRDALRS